MATKKTAETPAEPVIAEQVVQIPLTELHPFEGHPFKVLDVELMQDTVDSIMQFGVLTPAIARPDPDGGYEMVAGHRRLRASEIAGKVTKVADDFVVLEVSDNVELKFQKAAVAASPAGFSQYKEPAVSPAPTWRRCASSR